MFMNLGEVAPGSTLYCPFATYNSSGASVTITGLAVTDIEIYKNGSVTQRSSDAGYALLDTDGIDFDGITGVHGFSVDLSDNTDSGFYVPGSTYWIVVSTITVDSQTVTFGYYFTISRQIVQYGTLSGTHSSTTADLGAAAPANDISGQTVFFVTHKLSRVIDSYNTGTGVATFSPSVAVTLTNGDAYVLFPTPPGSTGAPLPANVTQFGGTAGTFSSGRPEVNTTHVAGTSQTAGDIIADTNDIQSRLPAALVSGRMDASVGAMAANVMTAAAAAADLTTELQSGLATAAALDAVDNFLDTEIAAILALLDDPRGEPGQGSPPVNPDLATKIDYLYKAWRNRSTQTASEYALYADDGTTKDHEAACSSDGTTLVRGEVTTGA